MPPKLLRRTLSVLFFLIGLIAFFVFANNANDIAEIGKTLWALFFFSVSFTVVLVLNH